MKKILVYLFVTLMLCLGIFEVYYQLQQTENPVPTQEQLQTNYAKLEHGTTYYEVHGQPESPLVVLIHGFSTPHFVFDLLIEDLVRADYRVLTYDLLGRGLSDKPSIAYTQDVYVTQLEGLLAHLKLQEQPKILVGYSMGGLISAAYTQEHPKTISGNIYIAPAGLYVFDKPWLLTIVPSFLAERLFSVFSKTHVSKIHAIHPATAEQITEQARFPGYYGALISTMQNMKIDFRELYRVVAKQQKPSLFIWGEADKIVLYDRAKEELNNFSSKQLFLIKDAGHMITLSHPQQVTNQISTFGKKHATPMQQ